MMKGECVLLSLYLWYLKNRRFIRGRNFLREPAQKECKGIYPIYTFPESRERTGRSNNY